MFCPNCGKSNPDGSKFCENCGSNMLESNGVQQAAPQQPVAPPPAPVYQQPPQPQYQTPAAPANLSAPLSVGGFLGTMIVMAIPIVNIIMLFVWGFGANANLNRKNLCRRDADSRRDRSCPEHFVLDCVRLDFLGFCRL